MHIHVHSAHAAFIPLSLTPDDFKNKHRGIAALVGLLVLYFFGLLDDGVS